ncbi:MAG: hypothetical protein SGILL_006065, partial [Bacillariaceae sp.]
EGGMVKYSTGRHDLGEGFYAFKNLHQAINWAVSRTWDLFEDNNGSRGDNAGVMVMQDLPDYARDIGMELIDVGSKRLFKESDLADQLNENEQQAWQDALKRWIDIGDEDMNWKEFVLLSRCFGLSPQEPHIYYGLLHEVGSTSKTDDGADPVVDPDGWIQYCVRPRFRRRIAKMGRRKLFLEFEINWDEWYDPKTAHAVRDQMDEDIIRAWYKGNPQS